MKTITLLFLAFVSLSSFADVKSVNGTERTYGIVEGFAAQGGGEGATADGTTARTDAFRLDLRPSPRAVWPSRTECLIWDARWAEPGSAAATVRLALEGGDAETPSGESGDTEWTPDHGGLFEFSLASFDAAGEPIGEVLRASFVAPDEAVLRRASAAFRVLPDGTVPGGGTAVSLSHAVDPETGWHTVFTCTNLVEQAWVAAEDSRPTSGLLARPGPAETTLGGWLGNVRFFTLVTSMYKAFKRGDQLE